MVSKEVVTDTELGTPPVESEEAKQLAAEKAQLEAEIAGLEGTKASLLDDVVQARKEKKEVAQPTPQVDVEAIKKEVEASILKQVSPQIDSLKQELVKAKDSEIAAKRQVLEGINARMASVSGSSGPSSPGSLVENEVELSDEEKAIAKELGIQDPRYLKDTELKR